MGSLADVFVRIRGDTKLLTEDTRKGGEEAGKAAGGAFHGSFTGMIKQAAVTAGALLGGSAIYGLGKMGLQAAADMQQAQIAFTTLTGSAKTAQGFLSQLKDFAAKTPFELPGLVDDARLLMGVGKASQDVIPSLSAWGNAASALGIQGEGFHRVMIALSQSMSAGKINAGDMNQMIEAGIPVWSLMAQATGKTVPELRKLSEHGELLAKDVLPKLEAQMNKNYGGAMEAQSQSLTGVWSTFTDTLKIGMSDALTPLIPLLSAAIPQAASILGGALSTASGAMADFIKFFQAGWKDGTGAAAGEAQQLGHIAHEVFDWFRDNGVPILKGFGAALLATAAAIQDTVRWFNDHRTAAVALAVVIGALVAVTQAHAAVLAVEAAGGLAAYLLKMNLVAAATKVWTAVQWLLNIAMEANPIGLIIIALVALAVGFAYLWTHSETFRNFFIGMWDSIWGLMKTIGAWFAGPFADFFVAAWHLVSRDALWLWHTVLEPMWLAVRMVVLVAVQIIVSAFNLVNWAIKNTLGVAIMWLWHNVFEPAFHGIATVAVWLWDNGIKPAYNGIVAAGKAVGDAAVWLWHNAIEPAMHGIGTAVSWVWNNVISPTWNAIVSATQTVGGVLRNIFSAIGGYISSAFSNAAGIVRGALNGIISAINSAISGMNGVIDKANSIPGVNFPHIPEIPHLATGGVITRGGRVLLGEAGAEVVDLPAGAAVYPHGSGPGGDTSRMEALLEDLIDAVDRVAPGVGRVVNGTGSELRRLARAGA